MSAVEGEAGGTSYWEEGAVGERHSDGGSHWTHDGVQHMEAVRGTLRGAGEGGDPGGTGRGCGTHRRRSGAW